MAIGIKSFPVQQETPFVDFVGLGLNATDTLIRLPHFPEMGSKVEIISQQVLLGGQVASAAVACQRWGWRTRYIGKVGDDDAGRMQRAAFAAEGLESRLIEVPGCRSQMAFILVDKSSGERTVLWSRDPRLDFDPQDLTREWITRASLLHVDGHPCAPATVAVRWAREAGMIVTADLDNLYPGVEALLEYVDYAITSREFPERLTGISNLPEALIEIANRFGCRVTGATLGSDGVLAWDGSNFHYCSGFRVEAVDTTGAGDIFHAGLAHSLLRAESLDHALEFGCAAAALNCTALGARGGIRPVTEIEQLMRKGERRAPLYNVGELHRYISSKRLS